MEIKILGARGSVPVSGERYYEFGGATNCIFIRLGGEVIVLDAGTGILNLTSVLEKKDKVIHLLVSHPHADHILGLGMCPLLFKSDYFINIYGKEFNGRSIKEQIEIMYKPPLWPVSLSKLGAHVDYKDVQEEFNIGKVSVKTMTGKHPGGVTLYRLECDGESLVYATDCTLVDGLRESFLDFAKDCNVLLIDGQYNNVDWDTTSEYGHNTWEISAHVGLECNAERTLIIHHDAFKSDADLRKAEKEAIKINPTCCFAREISQLHTETELTERFLTSSISISAEHDREVLLSKILDVAIELARCDAGTLYLKTEENLEFCRMVTRSLGVHRGGYASPINMPNVPLKPEYVCSWSAINNKIVNLSDIHSNNDFNFTGSYQYDQMIGYSSKSMLVVPITDEENEVIGILQLINAMDENGIVCPFNPTIERLILALASQAAICITNIRYSARVSKLLGAVISALSEIPDFSETGLSQELEDLMQQGE